MSVYEVWQFYQILSIKEKKIINGKKNLINNNKQVKIPLEIVFKTHSDCFPNNGLGTHENENNYTNSNEIHSTNLFYVWDKQTKNNNLLSIALTIFIESVTAHAFDYYY